MMLSCKILGLGGGDDACCKISRTLALRGPHVAADGRQLRAGGVGELVRLPTMEPVILSSRNRLGRREWKRTVDGRLLLRRPPHRTPWPTGPRPAPRRCPAAPGCSGCRPCWPAGGTPATGLHPGKGRAAAAGRIFSTAAVVSASRAVTSTGSVSGPEAAGLAPCPPPSRPGLPACPAHEAAPGSAWIFQIDLS